MSDITVKRGDKYTVTFTANMDLTGATVRLIARRLSTSTVITLAATVTSPATGVVAHTLTGTLDPGDYRVELEATYPSGDVVTFPTDPNGSRNYLTLSVVNDLG